VADFPHHTVYLDYLYKYARAYKLLEHIRYNTAVTELRKTVDGWEVAFQQEGSPSVAPTTAVAVCSGLHHIPLIPDFPNRQAFQGSIVHSSLLKSMEDLKGKRVVVVGGGESGADMVKELTPLAGKLYFSLRRGMALTRNFSPEKLPADFDSTQRQSVAAPPVPPRLQRGLSVARPLFAFQNRSYTLLGLPLLLVMWLFFPRKAAMLLKDILQLASLASSFQISSAAWPRLWCGTEPGVRRILPGNPPI
jgi:hypothetical protein